MSALLLAIAIIWNPCQDPSSISLYGIHFGTTSRPLWATGVTDWEYENYIYINGTNTCFHLAHENFAVGVTEYIALTCVDGAGNESGYSVETSYVRQSGVRPVSKCP